MRLIFVDDEPLVLQALQRSLRPMRSEWSMEFVTSAHEALEMMSREPFDVIVTDMRMPGMDGAELLQAVKRLHPQTVRIVLSGQSSRETMLRSVSPSHQLLSKPCEMEELKARIGKAFILRDLLENAAIKSVISRLSSVPSLPALYEQIVKELQSPDPSVARVGAIVAKDAGMTAKILQLANSALLGLRRHISCAPQAVSLIGLDTIRALVISVHIFSHFDETQLAELNIDRLWKHSLATASVARAIGEAEHAPKEVLDDSFTAGLLHDIGKLILIGSMPDKYRDILASASKQGIALEQAERDSLQCNHAEVGAYLIGIWGLPHSIVEAVALHHAPLTAGAASFSPLTAVYVANTLISAGEFSYLPRERFLDKKYLEDLGLASRDQAWRQMCEVTLKTMNSQAAPSN